MHEIVSKRFCTFYNILFFTIFTIKVYVLDMSIIFFIKQIKIVVLI